METSQQELEQYQETHNAIITSALQEVDREEREESQERETTANIPVVRGNTPRLTAYSTIPSMLQEHDAEVQDEQFNNVAMQPFPSKPPSAPPVPEAEMRFDVIEKSRLPQSIQPLQEEQIEQVTSSEASCASKKPVDEHIRKPQQLFVQASPLSVDENVPSLHTLSPRSTRLVGFAIYLLCLLLVVLVFAVVQGVGAISYVLAPAVALLGVPWMVLVYGLLAGCVSCLVTLGRYQHLNPPVFVLITWYARPFAAVVLALFAYLLLNSGLLLAEGGMARHQGFALVVGAIAGLCEGWLFLRRNERA